MTRKVTVIQTSLSKNSKTQVLAEKVVELLKKRDVEVDYINLKDYKEIPFCDGRDLSEYSSEVQEIHKRLDDSDLYVLGYPVYNYCFSGVCKNFIDIFSHAMSGKKLGIINNSGGVRSWNHGVSQLMGTLGMHNNITVVQPAVHSHIADYDDHNKLVNDMIIDNLNKMIDALLSN